MSEFVAGAASPDEHLRDSRRVDLVVDSEPALAPVPELVRLAFAHLPDPVVVRDDASRFALVNDVAARLCGASAAELTGKPERELALPASVCQILGVDGDALPEATTIAHVAPDGTTRHYQPARHATTDAAGRSWIICVGRDVTHLIAAHDELAQDARRMRTVFETSREGIWEFHVPTQRLIRNGLLHQILALPNERGPDDLGGFLDLVHPDDLPAVRARVEDGLAGRTAGYQSEHRMTIGGRPRWVAQVGAFVERAPDGRPIRVVGTTTDIHDRKVAEEELRRVVAEQDALLATLREAQIAASAAAVAKTAFLATMSHEIRTPLNGVLGVAQLMLDGDVPPAQVRDFAQTIVSSGQSLLAILNDVLDLSKSEAGRLELEDEPFAPASTLADIAALYGDSVRDRGIAFTASWVGDPEQRYRGDEGRIRQILNKLVGNAAKFTDGGGILISARERDRDGHCATLEFVVADSGIGIAADKLATLFQPFTQADSGNQRQFGGTGLGLAIVRTLAERMGGDVSVSSKLGAGARFRVRIVVGLLAPRPAARTIAATPTPPLGHHRVLLVEDNAVNCKVVSLMLARLGAAVDTVDNGVSAIETAIDGAYSLVLMDIQMPGMNGYDATREIRRREQALGRPALPIVALTANAFDSDRELALAAGMNAFITKPLQLSALADLLTATPPLLTR